jgi:hypothetical protein
MRRLILLLMVSAVFSSFSAAQSTQPTQPTPQPISITVDPGLEFSFNSIRCLVGTEKTANTFTVLASRLALKMDVLEYLSLEVLAGYHYAYANDALDFTTMPLSLRWDREKFSGLLLGIAASSEPYTTGDFSLKVRGEFTFAMEKAKTWEIVLPAVSGQATGDNAFTLLTLDATLQYDGFTGATIFVGPRFNLLHGKFTASESIVDLQGQQEISYRQKNFVGVVGGAIIEIGGNWELYIKASLFARTELMLAIVYVF